MVTTGYATTAIVQRIFPGNQRAPLSSPALPPVFSFPALDNKLPVSALPKVYTVVDEMFLAGEIRETSQTKVLKQLLMLQSLE